MLIYWGGRLGFLVTFKSFKEEPVISDVLIDVEQAGIGFLGGPATGVEYFFTQRFSLGGEVRVMYVRILQENDILSQLYSRALFFVRWYLGMNRNH